MTHEEQIAAIDIEITEVKKRLSDLMTQRSNLAPGGIWIDPDIPLVALGLKARTFNSLYRYGNGNNGKFHTVKDVVDELDNPIAFWELRQFGKGSFEDLITRLRQCGYISEEFHPAVERVYS